MPDATVNVENELGRSALHCAASSSNHAAVTVLIKRGEANVLHQDILGQTPLHLAIQQAAESNPTEREDQKPFKNVIERLMENSEDIEQEDHAGNTPWAYANNLTWITALKLGRNMFSGPSTSDGVHSLGPLVMPENEQLKVCDTLQGDLVEFYTITKEQKTQEKRNYEKSYVVDMIYSQGPRMILERSRPRLTEGLEVLQCRWLHVPANNVCNISAPSIDF